ncbi:MAG: hypothetical protein HC826_02660, partial [Rhodospirillales bacterium]|nr:hypothetical protein [Rhodospirillales bacterium]
GVNMPYPVGLPAMDFLLTDPFLDPRTVEDEAVVEGRASARPVHLAMGSVITRRFPAVQPTPSAHPTDLLQFAADATLTELNPATIGLWARVLHRVPDSVLLLRRHPAWGEEDLRSLIELAGTFGVSHRIDLVEEDDPVAFFAQAQVGLLPLPLPRPQVAAAMLAAGIPPVCLVGSPRYRRFAGSFLFHAGLADAAIASDVAEYVEKAAGWAVSEAIREAFRHRLLDPASGLAARLDPRRRAADLEAALEDIWERSAEWPAVAQIDRRVA